MSDPTFDIDDAIAFPDNFKAFEAVLEQLDPQLGPALAKELSTTAATGDREAILGRLFDAMKDTSE